MLGALDAEWVVEVELQSHQTCIAKEMFVYSAEKDAIVYTETGRVVHIRQGKRKRSVCSHPKVAHTPLARPTESKESHQRLLTGLSPDRIREVYAATEGRAHASQAGYRLPNEPRAA